jgi:hypothetical protein
MQQCLLGSQPFVRTIFHDFAQQADQLWIGSLFNNLL